MAGPVITLATDFGLSDPYVGLMKAVILGINPRTNLVDLTHGIRPQSVDQAAFLISKSYRYFPPDSIHVVVVDPGVGTSRRALVVTMPDGLFVAPDNGILGRLGAFDEQGQLASGSRAYSLTEPAFWRMPVSHTFHGRDVFAPVAAHLSLGIEPSDLGVEVHSLTPLHYSEPSWQDGQLEGRVVHIDHYGNLVTDIEANLLGQGNPVRVDVNGESMHSLSSSYAEGDNLLAIIGSFNTLEVAARNASAEERLGARIGDTVRVVR